MLLSSQPGARVSYLPAAGGEVLLSVSPAVLWHGACAPQAIGKKMASLR